MEGFFLLRAAAADDVFVRSLVVARLRSEGLVAPSVDRTLLASDRRLGFTTTVWVVAGRLDYASHVRLAAEASVLTGLTDRLVLVLGVADLADRGSAGVVHSAHFAAG